MKTLDFNNFVDEELEKIKSILINKTAEYNLEEDRLSFFKRAAEIQHIKTDEALVGMMTKHVISIYDMVKSDKSFPIEKWNEKCIDLINYLLLLLAVEKDCEVK